MKTFTTLVLSAALAGCTATAGGMHGQMGHGSMHGGQAMQGAAGESGMKGMQGMHGKERMHEMHARMQQRMQAMDTNRDGMLSKEEFMKAQEATYDRMPKNEQGLVDMKRMHGPMRH